MKPKLYEQTLNSGDVKKIITCIGGFECSSFFYSHLGKSQSEQKTIVNKFQIETYNKLEKEVPNFAWQLEYLPSSGKRDSIDIYGNNNSLHVVIELDKHRADQVAKKFVSRSALFVDKTIFYISLCYPGTSNMNLRECIKYFGYCKSLSKRMHNEYAGFIIE